MNHSLYRPFYAEYAWAFDLIIDRPVEKECGVIAAWLVDREISPGAMVFDAGCGTGRYSCELARRGYIVHGVDLSQELIAIANGTAAGRTSGVSFAVADITVPSTLNTTPSCAGASSTTSSRTKDAVRCSQHSPARFDQTAH